MGWKKTAEEQQAKADLKAAKADLARHADPDSPEYLADHDRAVAAGKRVGWLRRG
jgi:hypothetical protein